MTSEYEEINGRFFRNENYGRATRETVRERISLRETVAVSDHRPALRRPDFVSPPTSQFRTRVFLSTRFNLLASKRSRASPLSKVWRSRFTDLLITDINDFIRAWLIVSRLMSRAYTISRLCSRTTAGRRKNARHGVTISRFAEVRAFAAIGSIVFPAWALRPLESYIRILYLGYYSTCQARGSSSGERARLASLRACIYTLPFLHHCSMERYVSVKLNRFTRRTERFNHTRVVM